MQRRLPQLAAPLLALVVHAGCASQTGSIGAILAQTQADGRVTVRDAPSGYPAASAGIGPGDEILLIDGRDVRGMSPEGIHQSLEGDVGTTVRLTVLKKGKIERVSLKRAPLAAK